MNRKEKMNKLFKDYQLNVEDTYKHKHYHIITRSGIDKIQGLANISISYDLKHYNPETKSCVIKAVGVKGDVTVESYGESHPSNCKNAYVVAMAEKRAMSRIVLKLCGFYELGVFGEEEADDFKR